MQKNVEKIPGTLSQDKQDNITVIYLLPLFAISLQISDLAKEISISKSDRTKRNRQYKLLS